MAYDIFGNDLRRGYCEVHPHVQQEYPCDLCDSERRRHEEKRREPLWIKCPICLGRSRPNFDFGEPCEVCGQLGEVKATPTCNQCLGSGQVTQGGSFGGGTHTVKCICQFMFTVDEKATPREIEAVEIQQDVDPNIRIAYNELIDRLKNNKLVKKGYEPDYVSFALGFKAQQSDQRVKELVEALEEIKRYSNAGKAIPSVNSHIANMVDKTLSKFNNK